MFELFILSELEKRFGKGNIGIYRDDGLCILPFTSGPKAERSRKDLIDIFKRKDFNITASTTLVITDFLDVTLNLTESKYYLFRKDNNTILYIDAKSNHPPSIIKELPSMVNKRLSALSCNEEEFKKAGPVYKQALKSSVFSEDLKYNENPQKRRKRRSRKITYFNPPFNSNVKTNIGREFLRLVREQFPPTHKYRKIFNKNTLKISYSCMENVEEIIKSHNAKILKDGKARPKQCNCPKLKKDSCPLNGHCRDTNLVYKAEVKSKKMTKVYYGICETSFKKRLANHKSSFKNPKYKNSTELSKFVWSLNDQNESFEIAWSIHDRAPSYKCGSYKCMLCVAEKLAIVEDMDPSRVLNKRSDLISWCPHRKKFEL